MKHEVLMRRLAKPMLFAAALIWGSSFFMVKETVDTLPSLYLLTLRFAGGALLLALVCWKQWKEFTWDYLWRGAVIGAFLCGAYTVQIFGLERTTPSNNAFLTAVYCVLVPFFYWFTMNKRPDLYNLLAAVLCVVGVALVSISGEITIATGDLLTLLGAVLFAAHIVAVANVSPGKNIYLLTVFQFAFAALFDGIAAISLQSFPIGFVLTPALGWTLFYLTVFCTTIALLFQNVGQVWSDPASASIILSLESVFGVLFSVLLYGDPITPRLLLGFSLIFIAVVCSETKLSFLPIKRHKKSPGAKSV